MAEREVDVVVVGAGPAGEVVAGRAAGVHGLETVLVERELVGGECSYWACMPSKALLRAGELLAEVERVPGAREAVTGSLDAEAVLRRRDEVIHDLDDEGQVRWLEGMGVELVRGHGRLAGERRVSVEGGDTFVARRGVVLAPGSAAAVPPVPGLREAAPWGNREVTTAKAVPSSLVVLGGGVVGVEMAQAWARLGSRVVLVEAVDRLLAREEPFAGEQVRAALEALGVEVRLGAKATEVAREGEGPFRLSLEDGGVVEGERLLVAVGRRALVDDLGLETVGVEPGRTGVEVDDRLRVPGRDWLYVVGDANGRSLLTHMGKYQGRAVADLLGGRDAVVTEDGPGAPRVVFTDPQVAAVGLTEAAARAAGVRVRVTDHPVGAVAGASFYGREADGLARIVVDEDRGVLVGATFTGPEVAEFLHAATIAIVGEVPLERLWHAVPSFPTRSEVWLRLLEKHGL